MYDECRMSTDSNIMNFRIRIIKLPIMIDYGQKLCFCCFAFDLDSSFENGIATEYKVRKLQGIFE